MFKMIGAMVVYGFALYGVVESADWLTSLMETPAAAKSYEAAYNCVRLSTARSLACRSSSLVGNSR